MSSHFFTKLVLMTLCMHGLVHMRTSEAAGTPLAQQCETAIQQLMGCLNFATGQAPKPSKDCCTSVTTMKDKQPVCLCFFLGQAHNGSAAIKSLGIQEAKLMQLPSACQLVNASFSNCPKLLGISPSSPAAAIFMNSSATGPAAATSPSSTTATDKSSGIKHENGVIAWLLPVLVSTFLCAIAIGNLKFLF